MVGASGFEPPTSAYRAQPAKTGNTLLAGKRIVTQKNGSTFLEQRALPIVGMILREGYLEKSRAISPVKLESYFEGSIY